MTCAVRNMLYLWRSCHHCRSQVGLGCEMHHTWPVIGCCFLAARRRSWKTV